MKPISNKEQVDWFLDACHALAEHPFWRRSQTPRIRAVSESTGVRFLAEHPNDTHLGDFVRQLRIPISPRESIYVETVRELLEEIVTEEVLGRRLTALRAPWKEDDRRFFTVVDDGKVVRGSDAWNLIVNSEYMHFDVEKRRQLHDLDEHNLLWMYQYKFYEFIERASSYVLDIGSVAGEALESGQVDWSRASAAPRDAA